MTESSFESMPRGWYPDPAMPGYQREWDGTQWVGNPVKLGAKGGFPKWLIPVIACVALGFFAIVAGAIAGSPDEEATAETATGSDDGPSTTVGPGADDLAKCNDGSFSDNPETRGTCSSHDGVDVWLAEYGECEDGSIIALRDDPECPDGGDLARLRPGFVPEAGPDDVAKCNDGTFSDNRDLAATCSSHDGVEDWLADYGRCEDGEIVRLDGDPRCPVGEELAELMPPDYVPPTTTTAPPTTQAPTTTAPPPTAPPTTADPYAGESVSQRNARQKAADYLGYSSFSRTGLIDQLEFEGFSIDDATYGVDAQNADWNQQAALKAAEYLDYTSFSRSGLIDQLVFEGFTQAEAEYGVSTTGLS